MLVRYIAQRAGKLGLQTSRLPDALVRSNPSLEAFGNAQTTRNSNSSRFAKFTKLHIGKDGALLSAHVATYLLEKSRVTQHSVGERNFHIFDLMLEAAQKDEGGGWRAQLRIPKGALAADFTYMRAAHDTGARTSRALLARTAAHGPADLASTIAILGSAGVLEEDALAVVRVAAVALHLGQAEWEAAPGGEGAQLARRGSLGAAQELVGISNLEPLLLERELVVPGASTLLIKLTPQQASGARDSLARGLYELAFVWLVAAINAGLGRGAAADGDAGAASPFVGLLDVFGFEDFEHNSFEQLCINYANERLQQLLVERLFRLEAKLYADEGVPHPSGGGSSFADNLGCVLLLSGKPSGIFRLLDSACITPQASDAKFIAAVNATHSANPFLGAPSGKGSRALEERFVVKHYAANVTCATCARAAPHHAALPSARRSAPLVSLSEIELARWLVSWLAGWLVGWLCAHVGCVHAARV
jgi:myosin-5